MSTNSETIDIAAQLSALASRLYLASGEKDARASELAELFCAMSDDGQARFFVRVAEIMHTWGHANSEMQLAYIGNHLRTCECSDPIAVRWIDSLAYFTRSPESHAILGTTRKAGAP